MSEKEWCRVDSKGRKHIASPRRVANFYCACVGCQNQDNRENPKYKRCSKGKAVAYCSKECQKKAWPSHKVVCGLEPDHATFQTIVKRIGTNPLLWIVSQILAVYKLGLHTMAENEFDALRSKPFGLALLMQYEPADVRDFLQLFNTSSLKEYHRRGDDNQKPVVAMPQIVAVSAIPEQKITKEDISRWEDGRRASQAKRSGRGKQPPIAIIRFSQWFGGRKTSYQSFQNVTAFLEIDDKFLDFARNKPTKDPSLPLPEPTGDVVADIANVVEFANEFIRHDAKNEYRLQTKLTPVDQHLLAVAAIPSRPSMILQIAKEGTAMWKENSGIPGSEPPPNLPSLPDNLYFMPHPESPSIDWLDYLRKKVMRERVYLFAAEEYGYDPESLLHDLANNTGSVDEAVPEVAAIALSKFERKDDH